MKTPAPAQPRLILASSSASRRAVLGRLGLPFEAITPGIDETPRPGEDAAAMTTRLALEKARAVAAAVAANADANIDADAGALILGGDQCAALDDGRIMGKPGDAAGAREQLAACAGRTVVFHSGMCLLDTRTGQEQVENVRTKAHFRQLAADEIARYVASDAPFECAGSIRLEARGYALFDGVSGDDPTALLGLPLITLCGMLRAAGVEMP